MRVTAILYLIIVLTPVFCSAQPERRLKGCVDPNIIATVLGAMRQEKSRPISEEQFRASGRPSWLTLKLIPRPIVARSGVMTEF